ncbi:globin family protein [Fictibacillus macauensis ZFHKF-1]|uniref:Globin family protein n=1 Tax=Fictibacillus macauensis ZFHKF-1 TaxID=1196324 RepID=I8AGS2_9BACL|nr:globin family protein [Fictibacillus macauensis]EIT84604.1 globin family protein [Fictibacillus macauensis ZFHKF-1]
MNRMDLTPYEHLGGEAVLSKLVTTFYAFVKEDDTLSPLFPDDLTETARKQIQFLTQFLGGPSLYTDEHGHPMLRARHMPFPISQQHATAWLQCMEKAMDAIALTGSLREFILSRLTMTAYHMVNTADEPWKGE